MSLKKKFFTGGAILIAGALLIIIQHGVLTNVLGILGLVIGGSMVYHAASKMTTGN